jgi:hypothetical protein
VDSSTIIGDIAGIATAIGVAFGAAQLWLNRAQDRTAFEDRIADKYRKTIKPQITRALLDPLDNRQREIVEPVYEYLDLCNEEVFLRIHGRVAKRTWEEWCRGICSNLTHEAIREGWQLAIEQLNDFDELWLLHVSGYKDPRTWNTPWRRVRGDLESASDEALQRRVFGKTRKDWREAALDAAASGR